MEGISSFEPNDETHKAFGDALRKAGGVTVLAYACELGIKTLKIGGKIPVNFKYEEKK
ncbi:MAG: hypothetical protein RR626_02015 [Anaerovoracaceae bacterium]